MVTKRSSGPGQANCFLLFLGFSSLIPTNAYKHTRLVLNLGKRRCTTHAIGQATKEELLVVVGGGAAGVYGAIHAKIVAPHLGEVVIEKGKPLSKVKVSGGGRCNVTNGHCAEMWNGGFPHCFAFSYFAFSCFADAKSSFDSE